MIIIEKDGGKDGEKVRDECNSACQACKWTLESWKYIRHDRPSLFNPTFIADLSISQLSSYNML